MKPGQNNEHHVYDDIVELDNQLPRWWLWSFYLTIAFSIPYFLYYVLGSGLSLNESYEIAERERIYNELALAAKQPPASEEELTQIAGDPERRQAGQLIYASRCVTCHGSGGEGGIGPNLADRYWIHGASLSQIAATIRLGVNDKGMPPWGGQLKRDEIHSVVAFVRSLKDTTPPNPKAPQGDLAP